MDEPVFVWQGEITAPNGLLIEVKSPDGAVIMTLHLQPGTYRSIQANTPVRPVHWTGD